MIYKHCIPCQISRNKVPQTYIEIFAKYGQLRRTINLLSLASIDIDGGLPQYREQPLTREAQPVAGIRRNATPVLHSFT
jgi:hypothetical protein